MHSAKACYQLFYNTEKLVKGIKYGQQKCFILSLMFSLHMKHKRVQFMFCYCFDTEKANFLILLGEMGVTAVVLGILHSHKACGTRLLWKSTPKARTLWSFICHLLHHLIQKHLWDQIQAILLLTCSTKHQGYLSVPCDQVRKALRIHRLLLNTPFSGANTRHRKNICHFTSLQMVGALSHAASHRPLLRAYGTDPILQKISLTLWF